MRTKEEHARHCEYISQFGISRSEKAHYSKVYGINRSSILHELAEFDVTKDLPQDLMHVLLEGVFLLHFEQLLDHIVNVSGLMTISQINSRIVAFPFAYFNVKPSPLTGCDIQGTQSGKCSYSSWQ